MKVAQFLSLASIFSSMLGLWADPASGLTIYRFGGEDRPKPPEEGRAGVDFRQLSWMDFDAEPHGEAIDLAVDSTGIQPLKRNPDFNIAPGIEEKGGAHLRANINREVWDGDTGTFWLAEKYLCADHSIRSGACTDDFSRAGTANIYLGGLYNIDRLRVISGFTDPGRTVGILRVHLGPRPIVNYGIVPPKSPYIVEVRDNREQILDIPIPSHEAVEFVQVALAEHNTDWEVNEIEVYAKGFVKQATYISDVIDFEQPMAWGDLRWSGVQESGAQVLIRTRSGLDDDADVFWRFTGRGSKAEVSRADYSGLKLNERAGITHDLDHWTFWSAPYDFADSSGTPVVSASPRRYFQFKVDFLPQENAGGQVGFVELHASEPVATNLVGEVWPVEAKVGQQSSFTYALRPTIRPGDVGFDRLEIETSSIISAVEAVRIGDAPVAFTVEAEESHRLAVRFPRPPAAGLGDAGRSRFRSPGAALRSNFCGAGVGQRPAVGGAAGGQSGRRYGKIRGQPGLGGHRRAGAEAVAGASRADHFYAQWRWPQRRDRHLLSHLGDYGQCTGSGGGVGLVGPPGAAGVCGRRGDRRVRAGVGWSGRDRRFGAAGNLPVSGFGRC